MPEQKEFQKPLDQWLDEPQKVKGYDFKFNPENQSVKLEEKEETVHIKTMYTKSESVPFSCADGKHKWKVIDRHNYTVKCQHCPIYKRILPAFEFLDPEGHIRNRENNQVIA